ncbi:MAG: hypothetical protein GY816_22315, partial [Cytophagales bacterium]|nr:hypothetical protein [Cytophagales bacterium]
MPTRFPKDAPLRPKEQNKPVGNQQNWADSSLMDIWAKMFMPVLNYCCDMTNNIGAMRHGSSWIGISESTAIKFICCLLRMAIVPQKRMEDYFSLKTGDPVILSLNISGRHFYQIYRNFSMYDPDNAAKEGFSNKTNKEKYDSLYKVRPAFNMAISNFQSMRTPKQVLCIDESMSKY